MQQPSFQKWGFARAKHQGPWCLLFLWCGYGWGLRIRVFSRKFCERVGESQSAFWREWPSKPCKNNCLISNNLSWGGVSVMLAACLQGYEEVIRGNLVWFGRWWMNLHKRSCCSTWVPRKINMEFAKDSRTIFLVCAKNGRLQIKEFRSTAIYLHLSPFTLPLLSFRSPTLGAQLQNYIKALRGILCQIHCCKLLGSFPDNFGFCCIFVEMFFFWRFITGSAEMCWVLFGGLSCRHPPSPLWS